MPDTLTYGRKKPIRGERGDTVFDALEDNIVRDDAHSHNGTDSAKVSPKDLSHTTQTLALASWAAVAGQAGTYRQLGTVPSGYTVDESVMKFFVGSGSEAGAIVHPTVEKVSATTYYVYTNDNTIDYKVMYG